MQATFEDLFQILSRMPEEQRKRYHAVIQVNAKEFLPIAYGVSISQEGDKVCPFVEGTPYLKVA